MAELHVPLEREKVGVKLNADWGEEEMVAEGKEMNKMGPTQRSPI